jgi:D-serine deaminase-like pyridoxal phosphate-dependent protein
MTDSSEKWYEIVNSDEISSPAVLVYPQRVENNLREMIKIAGSADRLRPHVKTHKMPELIRMQMQFGIRKFKCATIAEAEMTAKCGDLDILLALQPAGPNLNRFFNLRGAFKKSNFSCIADNENDIERISELAVKTGLETEVWLDINNGMNRTGIIPGSEAIEMFRRISSSRKLIAAGLHVYDGHLHEPDPDKRKMLCREAFLPVARMISELEKDGFGEIKVIAGGSPSFPVHSEYAKSELSPGTTLLWDYISSSSFRDLNFQHAALLLTRVISKPAPGLLCLDLGHKAIASEMPQPRVKLFAIADYQITGHNEEHMVIKTPVAKNYRTGDVLYGVPFHVCPTIDRHDVAHIIRNNTFTETWDIEARRRKLQF